MKSMLFHRLALYTNKEGVLRLARNGHDVLVPEDLINDPFVLEFLNLPEQHQYLESDLEGKLKYQLYLPDKIQLENTLNKLLD